MQGQGLSVVDECQWVDTRKPVLTTWNVSPPCDVATYMHDFPKVHLPQAYYT